MAPAGVHLGWGRAGSVAGAQAVAGTVEAREGDRDRDRACVAGEGRSEGARRASMMVCVAGGCLVRVAAGESFVAGRCAKDRTGLARAPVDDDIQEGLVVGIGNCRAPNEQALLGRSIGSDLPGGVLESGGAWPFPETLAEEISELGSMQAEAHGGRSFGVGKKIFCGR